VEIGNVLSVGKSSVGAVAKGSEMTQKVDFLSAKSKAFMSGSVGDAAGQTLSVSNKAPAIIVGVTSAGIKLGVEAAKAVVLVATGGAGKAITAGIDVAQRFAEKGIAKMQEGMQAGAAATKAAQSSVASFSDPLKAAEQSKGQVNEAAAPVKQTINEVNGIAETGAGAMKGAAGGPNSETSTPSTGSTPGFGIPGPDASLGSPEPMTSIEPLAFTQGVEASPAMQAAEGPTGLLIREQIVDRIEASDLNYSPSEEDPKAQMDQAMDDSNARADAPKPPVVQPPLRTAMLEQQASERKLDEGAS